MFLAISLADTCPRPVHVAPAVLAAIVAELERDEDFPAAVAGRCALCHGPLAAGEADATGVAHATCGADEWNQYLYDLNTTYDIHDGPFADEFAAWVESCERDFGRVAGA